MHLQIMDSYIKPLLRITSVFFYSLGAEHFTHTHTHVKHSALPLINAKCHTNKSTVMQPQYKFQSSADHYRHSIPVPKCQSKSVMKKLFLAICACIHILHQLKVLR